MNISPSSNANVKHAQVVTPEEEDKLWESGAMGIFSPKVCYVQFSFMLAKLFVFVEAQSNDHLNPHNSCESIIQIATSTPKTGPKIIREDLELFTIPIR